MIFASLLRSLLTRSPNLQPRRPALSLEELETRLTPSSAPLHVVGALLEDPAGNAVVLRGVNVGGLESYPTGFYDSQNNPTTLTSVDTAFNAWHSNLIRVTVYQDFWFGHDEGVGLGEAADGGAGYRSLVDQIIGMANASNAYVMLAAWGSDMGSWGAAPALHDMPDDHTTTFWQDAAVRYANNPTVLFDPFNEPHDVSWSQWLNSGQVAENGASYHSPGFQGLLNAIRGTGADNLVAPEGLGWATDLSGIDEGYALNDSAHNLMYQFHLYPGVGQTDAQRDSVVQTVAGQYPIYVGEWGTYSDSDTNPDKENIGAAEPDAADWTQTMLAWLQAHQYSWTAWDLNPVAGPYLVSDWNYTPTTFFGAYVKDALTADAKGPSAPVAAEIPGSGVWRYEDAIGWQHLTAADASRVASDDNGDVVAEFSGSGVWRYEDATGWRQLTGADAAQIGIAGGVVAAEFAGAGVWRFEDAAGWQQLTGADAAQVAVDANGDVAAAFVGAGVWRYEDAVGWQQLTGADAGQIGIAGGIVAAEFAGSGVWRFEDAAGWRQLTGADASQVAVDARGDVAADFLGSGVWRYEDAAGWVQLTGADAAQVGIDGFGDVAVEFTGAGVWRYKDGVGWTELTPYDASSIGA